MTFCCHSDAHFDKSTQKHWPCSLSSDGWLPVVTLMLTLTSPHKNTGTVLWPVWSCGQLPVGWCAVCSPDITCTVDWGQWLLQTLDGICVWVSLWVLDSLLGALCFCKGCSWILLVNLCTDCVLMGCVLIPGEHTVWCQHWHHFLRWRQAQDPQPSWSCLRPPCLGLLSGKHCSLYQYSCGTSVR